MVPQILTFDAGQNGKKIVFGSDFLTYGAPFYKWCRFTYGAVTDVYADVDGLCEEWHALPIATV